MPLLNLQRAGVSYNGAEALKNVSLTINRGERVAFVGESGAGKSTLLGLLYEQCHSEGVLIPQHLGLVKALSVFHNIYMGRLHQNSVWYNLANLVHPFKREIEPIIEILTKLRLEKKLFSPAEQLSGGEQLRTAIGRALYHGGTIVLADEPVSAVDDHQSRAVLKLLNETYDTVLLAMHDVDLAIEYSDRIIGLRGGCVVLDQSTHGITSSDLDHLYLRKT